MGDMAMTGLTAKQQRFVDEYLVDLNASAAARRAGYSARRSDQQGLENMRKPEIAAAIAEQRKCMAERTQRTVDQVMADIKRIGDRAEADEDWTTALKARELEGKHLGAFTEKVQLTGNGGESLSLSLRVSFERPKPNVDDQHT